jgi:hypothetical protein
MTNCIIDYRNVVYINKYTTFENIKDKLQIVNTVCICICDYNDLICENDKNTETYKLISDLQNYHNIKSITLCWGFNKNRNENRNKNSSAMLLNLLPKHINTLHFAHINNFYYSTEIMKLLMNFKNLIKIDINTLHLGIDLPFSEHQNIITTQLDNLPDSLEELNIIKNKLCNCKLVSNMDLQSTDNSRFYCTCTETCIQHKMWCICNNIICNSTDYSTDYILPINNLRNRLGLENKERQS